MSERPAPETPAEYDERILLEIHRILSTQDLPSFERIELIRNYQEIRSMMTKQRALDAAQRIMDQSSPEDLITLVGHLKGWIHAGKPETN
jgi:hypothetical protein